MGAQSLGFGQELPGSGDRYLRLKKDGDSIQFRITQDPVYVGKHFIKDENGQWSVPECSRIASNEQCDRCDRFFEIKGEVKKLLSSGVSADSAEVKKLNAQARDYGATTEWYFAILDRGDETMKILQTTGGVRSKFNEHFKNGVNVLLKEWVLRNTGGVGVNKYSLSMVDSSDVKPLTDKEAQEYEKARTYDLTQISKPAEEKDDELTLD